MSCLLGLGAEDGSLGLGGGAGAISDANLVELCPFTVVLKNFEDDGKWAEFYKICIADRTGATAETEAPVLGA